MMTRRSASKSGETGRKGFALDYLLQDGTPHRRIFPAVDKHRTQTRFQIFDVD